MQQCWWIWGAERPPFLFSDAICARLGLDPDEWGAYAKAIKFAIRLVALELVKGEGE